MTEEVGMRPTLRRLGAVCVLVCCVPFPGAAAEPAQLEDVWRQFLPEVTEQQQGTSAGRKVIRCEHPCRTQWGFPDASLKEYFLLLTPAEKTEAPPLYVYLHAAGGQPHASAPSRLAPEFVALFPNGGQERTHPGWWWGYRNEIAKDPERYRDRYSPSENRVLATIEWTVRRFNVDRNRVYLMGYSMGGSGTLGLGMRRGDIFAALWVGVPAGIDHVACRMRLPRTVPAAPPDDPAYLRTVSGHGLPDTPPVVNFISQTDGWCQRQEELLRACQQGKHLMVVAWGPYGHQRDYGVTDAAAQEFPWLEIRRNEAYPVFTGASSDETYPGYKGEGPDQVGQVNAYFRWKVREDRVDRFGVDVWLVDPGTLTKPTRVPERSVADVTPRRLQHFRVKPGQAVRWQVHADGKPDGSGTVRTDPLGLVTVPRLTVTRQVRTLVLTLEQDGR